MSETVQALAQSIRIDQADIDSFRDGGWLTDTALRHAILSNVNFNSTIALADPTWMYNWVRDGMPEPESLAFLEPNAEGYLPTSLVIPWNIGGVHWATLYVDFANYRISFFDSMASAVTTQQANTAANRLFIILRTFFEVHGAGQLEFVVPTYGRQQDGYNCGVYACDAAISLLSGKQPSKVSLTTARIRDLRTKGRNLARAAMNDK